MSDPMTSVEIEDVLSSIRRLVSEDLRPAARAPGRGASGDPLVLTPALRVVTEGEGAEDGWTEVAAPASPNTLSAAAPVPEAPGLGLSNVEESAWEESELADGGWALPDLAALRRNPEARLIETAREAARPHRFTLTQAMAVPPAALAPEPEVHEPEATESGATESGAVESDAVEPPVDAFLLPDGAGETAAFPGGESFDPAEAEFLEAEPEAADGPDLDPDALADLAAQAFNDSDLMPDDILSDGPEMTYDEDLLRDLVRDLIREELAGDLGEKITRNIRKLVRAEIAQALAARALD